MPDSDDTRMRRLLSAQGAIPPVSDELEGSPAHREASDSDYRSIEAAQARARAHDMADAMTGGEHPATSAARGIVQGFMGGLTGASTGPSPASGTTQASGPTGAPPDPSPAVSDELEGTPANADEARMRALLRAQGQATPAPQAAPTDPNEIQMYGDERDVAPTGQTPAAAQAKAEPPEIEMYGDERDAAPQGQSTPPSPTPQQQPVTQGPVTSPSDADSPLPSVRERARAAQASTPTQSPPVADAISGAGPLVAPPEEPMNRLSLLFPRTLRPSTRARLEGQLRSISGDDEDSKGAREEVQQALDMDSTRWTVPQRTPPGLRPYVDDPDDPKSQPVPGLYVDAQGNTVLRTGDPARDARIQRFLEADSTERQLTHRDAREREASPDRLVPEGERRRLGLDQEGALNGNPDDVDSLTRKYILQNEPNLPGGFSDNLGLIDPQGRPTPPTEEDIAYRQGNMLDQSYKDSIEALARQRAVEELRQRQQLPLRQGYDSTSERVTQARIDALQRFTQLHRQYWDQARQAQARADAKYPNPDQLLGGRGSWSRAVALGIAAAGGGVGMSGAAAVVNNAMNLEWAGRTAAYNRERQRMADAAMNGAEAVNTMNIEDASLVGQQAAAKQRLADQFDLIAAQTGDQELRAKYQGLAAKLKEEAAKTLGTFATQTANRDLKNAQLGLTAAQIAEKRREFDLKHSGGTGAGGNAGAANPYGKNGFYDPMHDVYLQAPDPERAREKESQLEGISKSVRLIDHVLGLQQSQPGLWQKLMNKAGLTDEESATIQTYEADMIFALNEAHKMKRLTNKEEEIYEKVAADPHSIEKFMPQIAARLRTERTVLGEDAGEIFRQYGRGTNIPAAPGPAIRHPASTYFNRLSDVPVIDGTGAWMPDRNGGPDHVRPFLSAEDVVGTVDSGIEALDRDGVKWPEAEPYLGQARANLIAAQRKAKGQWLLMVQDRARLIKSGGTSGRDREAALERVKGAVDALGAGVSHIDDEMTRRRTQFKRQRYLDSTRDERFIESLPH